MILTTIVSVLISLEIIQNKNCHFYSNLQDLLLILALIFLIEKFQLITFQVFLYSLYGVLLLVWVGLWINKQKKN